MAGRSAPWRKRHRNLADGRRRRLPRARTAALPPRPDRPGRAVGPRTAPAAATGATRRAARAPARARSGTAPERPLRIIEPRILRGPNYWAREPVVRMVVDLG